MIDPAWIALIGTLSGGVVLKLTESWLGRSKDKVDDASRIRDELRLEITSLKAEVIDLEKERDFYRNQYYDLKETYIKEQTKQMLELKTLRETINESTGIDKSGDDHV